MEKPLTEHLRQDGRPLSIEEYEKAGGYQGLRKALRQMTPGEVMEEIKTSNLRGRGGAGFPTAMKWSACPTGPECTQAQVRYIQLG